MSNHPDFGGGDHGDHAEDRVLLPAPPNTVVTAGPPPTGSTDAAPAPASAAAAYTGLFLVIMSSAAFAAMSLLVSQSARLGIPSLQSASVRFLAQAFFSVLWISRAKWGQLNCVESWMGKATNRRLLVLRGFLGAIAMCCLFYAVSTLPLADATCIAFLNVPLTTIIAAMTLGERYTLADGAACVASSVGVLLVVQPTALFGGSADLPVLSVCVALLYACLSSCVFVTIRAIGPHESSLVLVLYFGATGCIVAPALLGLLQTPSPGQDGHAGTVAGLQIGVGVLGFVGQVLVNRGMQLAPASSSSAMRYSELIFALVFQVGVQGEAVNWLTVVGALLVMSGVGAVLWKARAKSRAAAAAAAAATHSAAAPIAVSLAGSAGAADAIGTSVIVAAAAEEWAAAKAPTPPGSEARQVLPSDRANLSASSPSASEHSQPNSSPATTPHMSRFAATKLMSSTRDFLASLSSST